MTNYIPYKVITHYLITALSKHCIYVGKINHIIYTFVNIVYILAWLQPPTPTHTSGGALLLYGQARPLCFVHCVGTMHKISIYIYIYIYIYASITHFVFFVPLCGYLCILYIYHIYYKLALYKYIACSDINKVSRSVQF